MKKTILLLMAAIQIVAVNVSAQNKSAGINLSLWHTVSTQPLDSLQTTYLNLGLFSRMNRLCGVGVNTIWSVVDQDVKGMQVSGLANVTGNNFSGIQVSGLTNVNGNNSSGILVTGLANVTGNNSRAIQVSGLANIAGTRGDGIMISGLLNLAGSYASGFHISGLANVGGGDLRGVAASGLLNIAADNLTGVQVSGLLNVAGDNAKGIQLAGVMNVTGRTTQGLQISLFNYSEKVNGLQIGLVNFYKKEMKGFQLGLINANPDTKVQLMLFGGNLSKINIGARFKNQRYYTILGGGTHYLGFGEKISGCLYYRAGAEFQLYKNLYISGDLGYQHIETFSNKGDDIPARLYALQARMNLEYKFTDKFALFASGGYGTDRYYNQSKTFDKGIIAEAGIILF